MSDKVIDPSTRCPVCGGSKYSRDNKSWCVTCDWTYQWPEYEDPDKEEDQEGWYYHA